MNLAEKHRGFKISGAFGPKRDHKYDQSYALSNDSVAHEAVGILHIVVTAASHSDQSCEKNNQYRGEGENNKNVEEAVHNLINSSDKAEPVGFAKCYCASSRILCLLKTTKLKS